MFFDFESMTVDTEFVDAYGKTFEYKKPIKSTLVLLRKPAYFVERKT